MKLTLRQWQSLIKDKSNLIVQASPVDMSDSWQSYFPIGMSYQFVNAYDINDDISKFQIGKHNNTIFCAIDDINDKKEEVIKLSIEKLFCQI